MNNLKYIREQHMIPATHIANQIGVSREIVNAWETGRKKIPAKRLNELSDFFRVPIDLFIKDLTESDKAIISRAFLAKMMDKLAVENEYFDEDRCGNIKRETRIVPHPDIASEYYDNEAHIRKLKLFSALDSIIGNNARHKISEFQDFTIQGMIMDLQRQIEEAIKETEQVADELKQEDP